MPFLFSKSVPTPTPPLKEKGEIPQESGRKDEAMFIE